MPTGWIRAGIYCMSSASHDAPPLSLERQQDGSIRAVSLNLSSNAQLWKVVPNGDTFQISSVSDGVALKFSMKTPVPAGLKYEWTIDSSGQTFVVSERNDDQVLKIGDTFAEISRFLASKGSSVTPAPNANSRRFALYFVQEDVSVPNAIQPPPVTPGQDFGATLTAAGTLEARRKILSETIIQSRTHTDDSAKRLDPWYIPVPSDGYSALADNWVIGRYALHGTSRTYLYECSTNKCWWREGSNWGYADTLPMYLYPRLSSLDVGPEQELDVNVFSSTTACSCSHSSTSIPPPSESTSFTQALEFGATLTAAGTPEARRRILAGMLIRSRPYQNDVAKRLDPWFIPTPSDGYSYFADNWVIGRFARHEISRTYLYECSTNRCWWREGNNWGYTDTLPMTLHRRPSAFAVGPEQDTDIIGFNPSNMCLCSHTSGITLPNPTSQFTPPPDFGTILTAAGTPEERRRILSRTLIQSRTYHINTTKRLDPWYIPTPSDGYSDSADNWVIGRYALHGSSCTYLYECSTNKCWWREETKWGYADTLPMYLYPRPSALSVGPEKEVDVNVFKPLIGCSCSHGGVLLNSSISPSPAPDFGVTLTAAGTPEARRRILANALIQSQTYQNDTTSRLDPWFIPTPSDGYSYFADNWVIGRFARHGSSRTYLYECSTNRCWWREGSNWGYTGTLQMRLYPRPSALAVGPEQDTDINAFNVSPTCFCSNANSSSNTAVVAPAQIQLLDLFPVPGRPLTLHSAAPWPGSSPKSTEVLQEYLIRDYKEHYEFLNFTPSTLHDNTSIYLLANWALGGDSQTLDIIWKHHETIDKKAYQSPPSIAPDKAFEHLGDRQYYQAYLYFFSSLLLRKSPADVLEEWVFSPKSNLDGLDGKKPEMLNRLMDGMFHPMLFVGYGIEFSVPGVIAEGLAQTAVHKATSSNLIPRSLLDAQAKAGPGTHAFNILSRVIADNAFANYTGSFDDLQKNLGEKIQSYTAEWLVDGSNDQEIAKKVKELVFMNVMIYAVSPWRDGKGFQRPDFALLHLVSSSMTLTPYMAVLSSKSKSVLLRAYFTRSIAYYISRARPQLPIRSFFAVPLSSLFPEAIQQPNMWLGIIQGVLGYADDHLCKVQRTLAHYDSLYGHIPAGEYKGTELTDCEMIDGTLFVRAAALTMAWIWRSSASSQGKSTRLWHFDEY